MEKQQEIQNFVPAYQPVSCDFIDVLETYSIQKRPLQLKCRQANGEATWVQGRIKDILTRNHEEFVKLEDGTEIRLDYILETRPLQ